MRNIITKGIKSISMRGELVGEDCGVDMGSFGGFGCHVGVVMLWVG